jgi:hypothetical protein
MEQFNHEQIDQEKMTKIVLELIHLNREYIWSDALERYKLIGREQK